MEKYIEGNKAAWEEAFENRDASWGADIPERIRTEDYPFFNEETKSVLKKAIKSIMPPYRKTSDMFPALIPLSMSEAVTYGISTPMMTSAVVQTGVSRAAVLYCLTCLFSLAK